jgi:phosphatidylcholine synthase
MISVRVAAWAVHALTASGAAWGFLALHAVTQGRFRTALAWMGLAVLIDALDGPLARRLGVARVLPQIDGTLLDNLIDYLNYAIVPAVMIHRIGVLPAVFELVGPALICVVSGFQFSHVEAKSSDLLFRGFPSYWNLVALYLLLLEPPPWVSFALVISLCVMVFVPIYYVYPSRTRQYRTLTLTLTLVYMLCLVLAVAQYPQTDRRLVQVSLLYVLYYIAISLKIRAGLRSQGR